MHCCYECTDRKIGCHSSCDKYIQEKAEHDRLTQKKQIDFYEIRSFRNPKMKRGEKPCQRYY